jgi:hypothetical protein
MRLEVNLAYAAELPGGYRCHDFFLLCLWQYRNRQIGPYGAVVGPRRPQIAVILHFLTSHDYLIFLSFWQFFVFCPYVATFV